MRYRKLLYTLKHKRSSPRKTSPDIRIVKKGSLTIEAAAVVPVFLFGMFTIISFMDIYRYETVHLVNICQEARSQGLDMGCSGSTDEELILTDTYEFRPLSFLVPLLPIEKENEVRVHPWTGRPSGQPFGGGGSGDAGQMVYITATGNVIHKSLSCSYLNLSVSMAAGGEIESLTNRNGEHYHACEFCSSGDPPSDVVYIAEYGNRYHNQGSCSSLKRTVRLVKESEAEGYHICSRCGGGE